MTCSRCARDWHRKCFEGHECDECHIVYGFGIPGEDRVESVGGVYFVNGVEVEEEEGERSRRRITGEDEDEDVDEEDDEPDDEEEEEEVVDVEVEEEKEE